MAWELNRRANTKFITESAMPKSWKGKGCAEPAPTITLFCWILNESDSLFDIKDSKMVDHLKDAIVKGVPRKIPLSELSELSDGTVLQPLGCWGCAFPRFCSCISDLE
jgi:hypothetical protein